MRTLLTTLAGRRTLVVITALAIVAVGGSATAFILDRRADRQAEVEAANAEVQRELADRYRELEDTLSRGSDAAAALRVTLEEHLTVSPRSDEQLQADRADQEQALRDVGERLQQLAERPDPQIPQDADQAAMQAEIDRLAGTTERAADLGDRFIQAAGSSEAWASALAELRAQAQRYVDTVENQPETHDPDRLRRLWEEEKAILAEYRTAAEAAAELEGLAPLAQAYLDYIDSNVSFADEMIALLEQGEIETYNQRLQETFESEPDPFGFQQAIEDATDASLGRGVFEDLRNLRSEANDLLAETREALADVTPSPVPTVSP